MNSKRNTSIWPDKARIGLALGGGMRAQLVRRRVVRAARRQRLCPDGRLQYGALHPRAVERDADGQDRRGGRKKRGRKNRGRGARGARGVPGVPGVAGVSGVSGFRVVYSVLSR